MSQVSIIIPAHNNWKLTAACLSSIAEHTAMSIEVIVVDNASADGTQANCQALGSSLFGPYFQYRRNGENLNFAGACNQGAQMARGEYLLFLNNDTEVTGNWLAPQIEDFSMFPSLGATGPLLVYPENGVFGSQVQHLGVCFTPFMRVGHLYQGIPAQSALARKRRFFQAITAACLLVPRRLFMEAGQFDEKFINGFEDLDFCARLLQKGLRLTVNPEAVIVHFESKTPGRNDHEGENAAYLGQKCRGIFQPDWQKLLATDGYALRLTDWGALYGDLRGKHPGLPKDPGALELFELVEALVEQPLWHAGWLALVGKCADWEEMNNQAEVAFRLKPGPEIPLRMLREALKRGDRQKLAYWYQMALPYDGKPEHYLQLARESQSRFHDRPGLARLYGHWIENYPHFRDKVQPLFAKRFEPFRRIFEQGGSSGTGPDK